MSSVELIIVPTPSRRAVSSVAQVSSLNVGWSRRVPRNRKGQSRRALSLLRGTDGSNPSPSTGESANFCFLSGGAPSATPRWHRVTAAPGRKVYGRGQFVTFTPEELNALDVESSKVIDLEKFVPRGDLDPVYFDSSYYLYPDCIASNQGARRAPRAVSRVARSCSTRR